MLIRDGVLIDANLRRDRLTRREIESEMRLAGIATISEVAWAILEPEGRISFIGKDKGRDTARPDDGRPT